MAKHVELDDIEVGMNITVLEWHEQERRGFGGDGLFGGVTTVTKYRDHSWVGDVMTVLAVDAPFVAAKHPRFDTAIELDTRRLRLAKVSDEYAAAMTKGC
jgi:hypothetical protein